MTWSGSYTQRGSEAAGNAVLFGATPLEALIVGDSASYGDVCFVDDRNQAAQIVQRNGRNPHPRSVARARRNAKAKGLLHYDRVMPGQTPPGARYSSTGGTTAKSVNFQAFRAKDPLTRRERRQIQKRRNAMEGGRHSPKVSEPVSPEVTQPKDRPRYSGAIAPLPEMPADLAEVVGQFIEGQQAKQARREQAEDARMMDGVLRGIRRPKPPD